MKRTGIAVAAALALVGAGLTGSAFAAQDPSPSPTSSSTSSASGLSPQSAKDLAFNREEERMARDLYQLFSDTYDGARPFSHIVKAEQQHFDAVGSLLQRYDQSDPSADRAAGSYSDPDIQRLYDEWKAQGLTSLQDAYAVGVALEKQDIADLTRLSATDAPSNVKNLYGNFLEASQRHLRAYTAASEGTLPETGQGMGPGNGPGKGNGAGSGMQRGPGAGQGAGHGAGQGIGHGAGQGMGHGAGQGMGHGAGQGDGTCPNPGGAA